MAKKKTKKKEKEKQQKDQESKGGGESAGGGKTILSKLPTWFYVTLLFFCIPNALGYVLLHPNAFHCIFLIIMRSKWPSRRTWLLWTLLAHTGFVVCTFFSVALLLLIVHEKELKFVFGISHEHFHVHAIDQIYIYI